MIFASRVKFLTTTSGTSDFEEGNGVDTFRNLSQVTGAAGRSFTYVAMTDGGGQIEIGLGVYTSGSPGSLSRAKVFQTWNGSVWGTTKLSFAVGTKTVSVVNLPEFSGAHQGEMHGGDTTGSADGNDRVAAYAVNLFPQVFAMRDFIQAVVRLHKNCAADATLAANGLTAKPILKHTAAGLAAVADDDYKEGQLLYLRFDATEDGWQVLTGVLPEIVPDASDTTKGRIEIATIPETQAGTDDARAVTPDGLAALYEQGPTRADGSTITIPDDGGAYFLCEGATTVSSIALEAGNSQVRPGFIVRLRFNATRTLNHSSALILLGDATRDVAAGEELEFIYEGAGVWREWGPPLPPDPPPQLLHNVAYGEKTGGYSVTGSLADTGLAATIGVTDADAIVTIDVAVPWEGDDASLRFTLLRGATDISGNPEVLTIPDVASAIRGLVQWRFVDGAPGTGTHVYKLQATRQTSGSGSVTLFAQSGPSGEKGQMMLEAKIPAA